MNPTNEQHVNPAMPSAPYADLTHFEWYMAKDDSPLYPMTFTYVWTLRGVFCPDRWKVALGETLKMHPLSCCQIGKEPETQRLSWRMTEWAPEITVFDFREENLPLEPLKSLHGKDWQVLDLSRESGLKVAVVLTEGIWKLLLTFHHAVTDGIGALEFASDLFDAYEKTVTQQSNGVKPRERFAKPASINQLPNRHFLDRSIPHPVSTWTATKFWMTELVKYMTRPAWNLVRLSDKNETVSQEGFPTDNFDPILEELQLVPIEFDISTTQKIRRAAQSQQCSQNEFLIAVCMSAIEKCKRVSIGNRKCWITAILPINMRRASKDRIPCHNGIGYSILRRKSEECTEVWSNASTIHMELKAVQDWSLAGVFLDTLGRIRNLPEWVHDRILKQSRPGTFVFSYLGNPTRRFPTRRVVEDSGLDLGDCQILDFAAAPPTRLGTELAILASTFHNRLALWLRYSPNGLSRSTVDRIAKAIIQEIDSAIE